MAAKAKLTLAPQAASGPNLYELKGGKLTITYSTSSIAGTAQFSFKKGSQTKTFSGSQIRTQTAATGTLVTVDIESVPDLKTVTFTLVLPQVNLGTKTSAKIATIGITTTAKTSIGGPALVQGQLQSYKVTDLTGTASQVLF